MIIPHFACSCTKSKKKKMEKRLVCIPSDNFILPVFFLSDFLVLSFNDNSEKVKLGC